jgi:alanyl-tRNA synthetase
MGARLANVQKCVRTQDIDEVGDKTHDTFFEMLGNWSLGDYFKEDAIKWSYELLTSKEEGFGLDPDRLYITVFEGDDNAPKDTESAEIWQKVGIPDARIYFMPAKSNWWSAGDNGPCGPDTEMFYDLTPEGLGDMTKEEYMRADEEQKVVEIWNDVFMEYEKKDGKVIGKLKNKNVDTGAGLERLSMVLQGKDNIFETDLFSGIMSKINEFSKADDERAKRIVADHIRTSVFMIADGVITGNTGRGYILRRLLRRAVRYSDKLGMTSGSLLGIADSVIEKYRDAYKEIEERHKTIAQQIAEEEIKFRKTLDQGLKEFEKGTDPFVLATTYGFPIELTLELAEEKGGTIDLEDFKKKMAEHQKLSQTSSAGMFKGGLANHNEKTVRLHTAHHLLLAALQDVVGPQVKQRGSNITEERLRIDFLCDHKLSEEEKQKAEEWVNDKIKRGLNVIRREMNKEEAVALGAQMEFGAKYADVVSVYFIEDEKGNAVSKEFCGGPHVQNTSELSVFKIQKEEAVAQGIRRIKGVLL